MDLSVFFEHNSDILRLYNVFGKKVTIHKFFEVLMKIDLSFFGDLIKIFCTGKMF